MPLIRGVQITGGLQMFGDQRRILVKGFRVTFLDRRGQTAMQLGAAPPLTAPARSCSSPPTARWPEAIGPEILDGAIADDLAGTSGGGAGAVIQCLIGTLAGPRTFDSSYPAGAVAAGLLLFRREPGYAVVFLVDCIMAPF